MHGDPAPPSAGRAGGTLDAVVAERLRRGAAAARELSDLLWEALHDELRARTGADPRAPRVAELSARLVDVASSVSALGLVVAREAESPADVPSPPSEPPVSQPESASDRLFASGPFPSIERPFKDVEDRDAVVIIDERDDRPVAKASTGTLEARHAPPSPSQIKPRPLPWDTPLPAELRVTRSGERPVAPADEPA